ncbi:MAG: BatA domain-containing protein [Gemmatimonadetes bacterium]|nr:BatA domain-containing protein [Gemmatimonadota bacterium]
MIAFLQPLWLLGLSAAAIPALLHLRQRQTPPTVLFPAVRYLHQTKREHSRRLKLRNLLLLILRTLIIVCVVLAAARPVARVSLGGVHAPTALAVIVDNSLSSAAVVGGRRLSDLLVERARGVIERVAEADHLWVMLADGVPRRLSPIAAGRLLDSIAPTPVRLDLGEAIRTASRAVSDDLLPGHEIVVFSDLQASALSAGEAPEARVMFWRPPAPVDNRGIDSARTEPAVWRPAGSVIVSVGGSGTAPSAIRLRIRSQEVARAVAAPGERVALRATTVPRGWFAAAVELDPDELRPDDEWHLALRIADPAAARAGNGAGRFVREGLSVLQGSGRLGAGDAVVIDDRLMSGRGVLLPPADPVLLGAVNRALATRGVPWRFGDLLNGEWQLQGEIGPAAGTAVSRRHRLIGVGPVLATAGGDPWMVRDRDLVILASRLEQEWTGLPVSAAFVPFLDHLVNDLATSGTALVSGTPGAPVSLPAGTQAVLTPRERLPAPSDARFQAPLTPGVYFLASAAGDTVGALEVNHDARESQLAPADRRALASTIGPTVELLDDAALERGLFRGTKRANLAAALLAAAVLAALAELGLATAGGRLESTA